MNIERTIRQMEWQKIKGTLKAILVTYGTDEDDERKYPRMKSKINEFIKQVDDEGLAE